MEGNFSTEKKRGRPKIYNDKSEYDKVGYNRKYYLKNRDKILNKHSNTRDHCQDCDVLVTSLRIHLKSKKHQKNSEEST